METAFMEITPTIPVGKYKNKTMREEWDIDQNYVKWFVAKWKTGTYTNYRGQEVPQQKNATDINLINEGKKLIELHYKEAEEKNKKECKSEYVGKIGERIYLQPASVISIYTYPVYTIINLIDNNGNLLCIYDREYALQKGDEIKFDGTPVKHSEKFGKKVTYFNRVNNLRKKNAEEIIK